MCILFVEDEFIITMMAEEALLGAGHKVMTAGHAAAAIDLIAGHPDHFTCLVTDLHMPGELNGADLVAHVRELYPVLPIVLATAMPHAATPVWRKRHRVELLDKPYSPKCLVQSVERLLHAVRLPCQAF
jgi:CheY-like chemotaxis protein